MILAIDQGTTGTTCIVFDDEGRPKGRAYSEFEQHFPRPGWVEHDAGEIWEVTRKVAVGALADAAVQGSDLRGIGITNQRETIVAWDPKTGEPVHRALVWQDRRTAAQIYGTTSAFGGEVPVAGIAGDQQAALFGQACQQPGETKNTYGTGSFVLLNTGTEAPEPGEGLLTTVAWGLGDRVDYALEAAVFVTGAAVQWLRDGLGIIGEASETEALAASLDSNDDVYFVPALTGLGSPHWDPYARGTIVGLTRGTGRAHLARAALESIAYQTVDAVRAQEAASDESVPSLKADGGAVENAWLMQFQADVLGAPVIVPEVAETTALGAAYLAGIATGQWTVEQVREMWREAARYEPRMEEAERDELLGRWREALARSRGWSET
jgi:glycerol kinase